MPTKNKGAPSGRPVSSTFGMAVDVESRANPSVLTHSFDTHRRSLFQRAPAPCILLQDDIGFGGPLEGLRFGVALGEPDLDGSLEIGDA